VKDDFGKMSFVHRSLQEYFVAIYLMKMGGDDLFAFASNNINRFSYNIISIMSSIDFRKCAKHVMSPMFKKFMLAGASFDDIYKTAMFMDFCRANLKLAFHETKQSTTIEACYTFEFSSFLSSFTSMEVQNFELMQIIKSKDAM